MTEKVKRLCFYPLENGWFEEVWADGAIIESTNLLPAGIAQRYCKTMIITSMKNAVAAIHYA